MGTGPSRVPAIHILLEHTPLWWLTALPTPMLPLAPPHLPFPRSSPCPQEELCLITSSGHPPAEECIQSLAASPSSEVTGPARPWAAKAQCPPRSGPETEAACQDESPQEGECAPTPLLLHPGSHHTDLPRRTQQVLVPPQAPSGLGHIQEPDRETPPPRKPYRVGR